MAIEHDLYTNIRVIDVSIDFEVLEVKVPIIFSDFSLSSLRLYLL